MHIDIDQVARLARLALTDDERTRFGAELDAILAYVDQLNELDTDDVPATTHPVPLQTALREDVAGETLDRAVALDASPEHDNASFLVPKIV